MKPRIAVIAHNIRSLWNVGSLFRCCDAFAVEHLYLTGYTPLPPRAEITKTALGAEAWVPWSHADDALETARMLRAEGWTIAALERTDGSIPLGDYDVPDAVCLILGHEVRGVPQETLEDADVVVHIPMHGRKESLNVSTAAGIALHILRES